MFAQEKERELSIVIVGSFNPQIFHPLWFSTQKLLGANEGESAKIEVIHPDIAVFHLDWLRFEVTRDRLVAITKYEEKYEVLRDLVLGTFTILSHTPLRMFGINNTFDCTIKDEVSWHAIGDKLAPKDLWKKVLNKPGLASLEIISEANEKDKYKNSIKIRIGPARGNLSLRIVVNNHFELTVPQEQVLGSAEIINILKESWQNSQIKATEIKTKFLEEIA
jgi:hypothetical protein